MRTPLPALSSIAFALLLASGCAGDNSGCGKPEQGGGSQGSSTYSGKAPASGGRAESIQFADSKSRVPAAFRRKDRQGDDDAIGAPAAPGSRVGPTADPKIIQRKVDGVADKVEVFCPVPLPPPGQCLEGPHFSEMKERCCPDGIIERCLEGPTGGLHIVGRGCGPSKPRS